MKRNILVVDDSESVRAMLVVPLQQAGFNILVGNNGADALNYMDGQTIDLVITDLYMPHMDGISFIRKAREIEAYKNTPMLLLTTESTGEKKKEAKMAGATGWLIKPFNISRLLNIIETLIRN